MKIIKRDGSKVDFELEKIKRAIFKAFKSVDSTITDEKLEYIAQKIVKTIEEKFPVDHTVTVEEVQDLVELNLIDETTTGKSNPISSIGPSTTWTGR